MKQLYYIRTGVRLSSHPPNFSNTFHFGCVMVSTGIINTADDPGCGTRPRQRRELKIIATDGNNGTKIHTYPVKMRELVAA